MCHPILFKLGPLTIGSYGVLLACAFMASFYMFNSQFAKNGYDVEIAWDIDFLAIFGGMVGSRLLFIIENFSEFISNPIPFIFSTTGFSVLGGYILAFVLCAIRMRMAKIKFLTAADMVSPGLAIGYAVGRLGCLVSGDGCYGIPTHSSLGMSFSNGIVSTLSAKNPNLVQYFKHIFPGEAIPKDIFVHPTPMYESISQFILFFLLLFPKWKIGPGNRFAFFLCWFGTSRFLVEFIRLNPKYMWGLTDHQFIAALFVLIGLCILGYNYIHKKTVDEAPKADSAG